MPWPRGRPRRPADTGCASGPYTAGASAGDATASSVSHRGIRATEPRASVGPCWSHIRQARVSMGYGAVRTRLWLLRTHRIALSMGTIQRAFRDLGLPYLRRTPKRPPRQLKLFEKAEPG